MCEWCTKHGDGKKWYLNVKNYSKELAAKNKDTEKYMEMYIQDIERVVAKTESWWLSLLKVPGIGNIIKENDKRFVNRFHTGQVLTLEDAKRVIDLASPIAKMPCACRRMSRGIADEKICLGFGLFLDYLKEWPDYTCGGIDYISREEAKELLERCDESGRVHTIWTLNTPFVAGLCQCTYPECQGLRFRLDYNLEYTLKKSEYYADIDPNKCTVCGKCVKMCCFHAIKYSPDVGDIRILRNKCFGCGLCRGVCDNSAISLQDRNKVVLREKW